MTELREVRRGADRDELLGEVDADPTERDRRLDRFHRRSREDEPIGITRRSDQAAVGVAYRHVAGVHALLEPRTDDANERYGRRHALQSVARLKARGSSAGRGEKDQYA